MLDLVPRAEQPSLRIVGPKTMRSMSWLLVPFSSRLVSLCLLCFWAAQSVFPRAPSVGREAVLANVFFSDGTSRTVLYTAAEPPVWEAAAQTTAPWIAFLPLVAVMVLIAARLAPN